MVRTVLKWPDPLLNVSSVRVDHNDDLKLLIHDLLDTMYYNNGVGLSAIQIGVPLRVFVMDADPSGVEDAVVIVNPSVIQTVGVLTSVPEGCLSVPGITRNIFRYPGIVVDYFSPRAGIYIKEMYDGLKSQCFQHEYEHLDGELYLQHLTRQERTEIKRELKKGKNEHQTKAD